MPNRLDREASLYLRQHAHNPVDWWPWCDEAFAEARERDVPVLLSVGYSSCHWCHVMAHESFEDPTTAGMMNADFVPVKVDREERPDVDAIYMDATVAMTGQGGWPMTVFLTPGGEPFWAGTYFPPEPRHGMPSFMQVLDGVIEAWRERRTEVMRTAAQLTAGVQAQSDAVLRNAPAGREQVDGALAMLPRLYDDAHGGFGGAPKFPPSLTIDFLLRRAWADPGNADARHMTGGTLRAMAAGGVFDQVGGGFHRYSVDDIWLVPHFEKMLYDNAMLLADYALAARVLDDPAHAAVADRIATWMLREMRTDGGALAAAQDADSPGGEGAFFTWTPDELRAVLPPDQARAVMQRYGVGARGNFEGRSILHVAGSPDPVADAALPALYAARASRPAPARDDKVIASWNGLAIRGLADAGRLLDRPEWVEAARVAARFVLSEMVVDGRLMRVHADGRARHLATLDDHADLADGLLALYAADFDPIWVEEARGLAQAMLDLFPAPGGGFTQCGADAPALVVQKREIEDHPTPAGNAQAAWVLAHLWLLTGDGTYRDAATGAVALVGDDASRWPIGYARSLATIDLLTSRPTEIAIVGATGDAATGFLVDAARSHMGPAAVLAVGDPADPRAAAAVPLLANRPLVDGQPAAYVCSGFTCAAPVTDPVALVAALGG